MNNDDPIQQEVKQIFLAYLEKKSLRKTQERFAILEEIYSMEEHFDVESLFIHLKNNGYEVSLATVYNTLDLLHQCNLVSKHQFGSNQTQYEKSFASRQHDHIICSDCNKVIGFCDPRIQNIQNSAEKIFGINITHHSLILYGNCKKLECQNRKSFIKFKGHDN